MASEGGAESKLKPLAKSTIARRKRNPRLSSETTPETSNLTETGAMLNTLHGKVKGDVAIVTVANPQLRKAQYTNESRPWINLSADEQARITAEVKRLIQLKLRRL